MIDNSTRVSTDLFQTYFNMVKIVANETMFLENQLETIKELQRERDIAMGRDPMLSARQRLAATRDVQEIIISSSETEKHENQIKLLKPKFAQLALLMDNLNKVASQLEQLQPSLKRLQDSPQRRKQLDAT